MSTIHGHSVTKDTMYIKKKKVLEVSSMLTWKADEDLRSLKRMSLAAPLPKQQWPDTNSSRASLAWSSLITGILPTTSHAQA